LDKDQGWEAADELSNWWCLKQTPAAELFALTCEIRQARVEHAGPRQPLELHVLEMLWATRRAWSAPAAASASLRTARCRFQRVEGRPSRQKVMVMVVGVTINGVMIQVILVVIGSEEGRSHCR
jgi:hypothetical protein